MSSSAHTAGSATFTSYAFSASFVEAVLVERLMRGGATEATILVDPLGYRMALRERGAVRIGREYVVHPVAVANGCFHPKVMVLEADDAVHATVGSGNLTFSGWSANLECVEHLHDGGDALALGDLGGFFAALGESRTCDHDACPACRALGRRLVAVAAAGRDDGSLRIAHSLERPIVDAIADAAAGFGGAERLTVASPYWDGVAIDALAVRLNVDRCGAHVPVARVPAPTGMDWPRDARLATPVRIEALAEGDGTGRPLHAKMVEVACAGGRVTVAGSANATTAGLMTGGPSMRNVEVCAVRTAKGRSGRWKLGRAAAPPKPSAILDEDADADADVGVLVSEHDGGGISGRVITRWRLTSAGAPSLWERSTSAGIANSQSRPNDWTWSSRWRAGCSSGSTPATRRPKASSPPPASAPSGPARRSRPCWRCSRTCRRPRTWRRSWSGSGPTRVRSARPRSSARAASAAESAATR